MEIKVGLHVSTKSRTIRELINLDYQIGELNHRINLERFGRFWVQYPVI